MALTHLDMSDNEIMINARNRELAVMGRLAGAIRNRKALAHLDLSTNHFHDEGAGSLAEVLLNARRCWCVLI